MKSQFLAVLLSSLVAPSAFAAGKSYDLKVQIAMDGKNIANPHIVVKEGEKGSITTESENEKTHIEVIASEGDSRGIMMKFTVSTIGANGKKTVISQPQILALENELAKIYVDENNGRKVSLAVLAQRIQ